MPLTDEQRAQVFQAIGQASLCWTKAEDAGVFLSELACKVGLELIAAIEGWSEE